MTTKLLRLLAVAFTAAAVSAGAAIPPPEDLLPGDTLVVVTVPDFNAARAAGKQSPGWLLWNDPAMKPFHDKFMSKLDEKFTAPLENDLGLKVDDFTSLPQGQLTFAVTQNGWTGGDGSPDPGILLLLDAKDKTDLLKSNLATLKKKWQAESRAIHTETVRGVDFTVVPLSTNDLANLLPKRQPVQELGKETPAPKAGQLVIGQYKSLLIVGNSLAAVEPVVAHLTGGAGPSLDDDAVFSADKVSQLRNSPLYYGWFNAKTLFSTLASLPDPEPNPEAPTMMPQISVKTMLNASGLMGLKSASLSYRETHEGDQMNLFLNAPDSTREGLLKILSAAQKDASPPPFVPADAVKFSRWRLNFQNSWDDLMKMLGNLSPSYLAMLNGGIDTANALAQQKDPDFDLRKNLIGNLGDDFISYQKAPAGKSAADLNNPPSIFLVGSPNPDRVVLALNSVTVLFGGAGGPPPRDFMGRKIYTMNLPGRRATTGAPVTAALYCAAANGYVAFSSDSAMIEEFLRSSDGKTQPLRATPGLMDAAQRVGGTGTGLFGWQNQRNAMRPLFSAFKNAAGDGSTATPMMLPPAFRDWMDFSLLPDYDSVSKYFYFSVFGGSATPDGISLQLFAPRPPQLN
jgi:hypothetical protein